MASGLGIDLGSGAIKVVRLRKRGAAWEAVSACRMIDPAPPAKLPAKPNDPVPPRELDAKLVAGVKACGFGGGGALGITGRDLMVKYVSTPPVPPWKLRMMMDLEIKGTSGAEVCGDYAKLNIPGDLTREMVSLVAVAKTGYVESQLRLTGMLGLGTEFCCPNAVALFNAFVASAQFRPGETTAVLDIGRDNIELVIQRDGVLYFARSTPGGGRRFTDAVDGVFNLGYERAEQYKCARAAIQSGDAAGMEASQLKVSGALREVADTLASTLRGAVMFAKAQAKISKLDIERLVLSGGGARMRGMAEYLKDKLKMPVDMLDPASRIDISKLPREQQALFEAPASAEMSVAIGLAQAAADENAFRLSVLPDKTIKTRRFWRGTIWGIAAAVAVVGVLGLDYYSALRREEAAKADSSALDAKRQELEDAKKNYESEQAANNVSRARNALIAGHGQRNMPILGFLKLMRQVTPEGVTIEKVSAGAPEEGSGAKADEVDVKVSGRADPAKMTNVYDTLQTYMAEVQKERKDQIFKVAAARITSERSELEHPAKGDVRIPFTFQVRLATQGLAMESVKDLDSRGSVGPGSGTPGGNPPTDDGGGALPVPAPAPAGNAGGGQ